MAWFGPVATSPDFFYILPRLILAAYVGSIIFFFRARKANMSKDFGPVELSDFVE